MPDGGQDADLIDCIVYLSVGEIDKFDLFQGIDGLIDQSLHFVHTRVSPLA